MDIQDHKLVGVPFAKTDNMGGDLKPEFLVIHYTVITSAAATVRAFQSTARQASAHLVLDLDGSFTQMVPFNRQAWHAGTSTWEGRDRCNHFTLGIEVVNPGPLTKRSTAFFDVNNRAWTGPVVEAKHKNGRASWSHWAAYAEAQIEALENVGAALVSAYGLRDVVGHDDIAPLRKTDPGPAFPMEGLRSVLFGRREDAPERYAATTILNVRKGPAVSFDTVPGSPLQKGQRVERVDEDGVWWHVVTDDAAIEGWVHSRYLGRV